MSEMIIGADEEATVKVIGLRGEKGDQGEKGERGPPGPPGGGSSAFRNIRDFGAKGDGVTDDTQAFLDLHAAAERGSIALCPPGNYIVSDTIHNSKHVFFVGAGSATVITQKADKDLFVVPAAGAFLFENLWLRSYAESGEAALIKLIQASNGSIRNVWITGGVYGVDCLGGLFNTIDRLQNVQRVGFPVGKAAVHGLRYGGRSVNRLAVRDITIQGGYREGVHLEDATEEGDRTYAEGSVEITGTVESVSDCAIYLRGLTLGSEIRCVHHESAQSWVRLVGCQNLSVGPGFAGMGIEMQRCNGVGVRECYVWDFKVDETNDQMVAENIKYRSISKLAARSLYARNFKNISNASVGAYGTFGGPRGRPIADGSMDKWQNGRPVGWGVSGTVVQDNALKRKGLCSANIISGSVRLPLKAEDIMGETLRVSSYCCKNAGGGNPRVIMWYNSGYMSTGVPHIDIPEGKWTRINADFRVPSEIGNAVMEIRGSKINVDDVIVALT